MNVNHQGVCAILNRYQHQLDAHQLFNEALVSTLNWEYLIQAVEEQSLLTENEIVVVADLDYLKAIVPSK